MLGIWKKFVNWPTRPHSLTRPGTCPCAYPCVSHGLTHGRVLCLCACPCVSHGLTHGRVLHLCNPYFVNSESHGLDTRPCRSPVWSLFCKQRVTWPGHSPMSLSHMNPTLIWPNTIWTHSHVPCQCRSYLVDSEFHGLSHNLAHSCVALTTIFFGIQTS